MQILTSYNDVPDALTGTAVALGNFDGVHIGHQAVIGAAKEIADKAGTPAAVLSFAPHPRRVFRPDDAYFELTPGASKARPIAELGVGALFSIPFDAHLAGMPARDFVETLLVGGLQVSHIIAGYDFVFGKGRQGNLALLEKMGNKHGFGTTVVEAVHPEDPALPPVSSTAIRNHLRAGRIAAAARLLGRPWEIEGTVMTGDQRGRQIGFPTANVDPGDYVNPALGVYACWVAESEGAGTEWRKGVVNIGRRPTFNGEGVTVEAHLFDFEGDLYGKLMRVVLAGYIRPEMKFDGIDAIRAQIEKDGAAARTILDRTAPGDIDPAGDSE